MKTFLTIIITAIIVGAGVYFWQSSKPAEEPVLDTSEEIAIDARVLLTPQEGLRLYNFDEPNCDEKFNYAEPANKFATYSSQDRGLSLEIPYNSNWGSTTYKINPYDETGDMLFFGPISILDGCSWIRDYALNFLTPMDADSVISDIHENSFPKERKVETIIINGLKVIKYVDLAFCNHPILHVVGNKYNYEFVTTCSVGPADEKQLEFLENIVKSIELID